MNNTEKFFNGIAYIIIVTCLLGSFVEFYQDDINVLKSELFQTALLITLVNGHFRSKKIKQ